MKEQIIEIITYAAPLAAGFITSTLIPFLIKKATMRKLNNKIDEVNSGVQFEAIKKELYAIKKEILEMRGKTK